MSKGRFLRFVALAAPLALLTPAWGQSVLQVSGLVNGSFFTVSPGGLVALTSTGIGQTVTATVTVRYAGTSSASITSLSMVGNASISLAAQPTLPVVLAPNASTTFNIQYSPTSGNSITNVLSIGFTENSQPSVFSFNLLGNSPNLGFSYNILPDGALTTLNSGDRINFPTTNVGSSVSAVINILNSGSAPGSVGSISTTNADYQITNSQASTTLQAGQQVSFTVVFSPHASGTSSATLTVALANTIATFVLSGAGAAPNLVVQYRLSDNNVQTLGNGGTITFPSVDINASTVATITILNQGTGSGSVTSVSVTGTGFQPSGLPSFPVSLAPSQPLTFGVVFAPTQAGAYSGTLRIVLNGTSITANLAASTATSNLTLSYIDPTTSNILPLANNGTLQFPTTLVGSNSTITLRVTNTGTGTGSINSINVGSSPSPFQPLNIPTLPLPVPPSQLLSFPVRFSPQSQQNFSDILSLNLNGVITTINLQGQGTQAQYTYGVTTASGTTAVSAGGTIALADTTVGQNTSVAISVSNIGTGDGQVANIGVTGQGLSLSGTPTVPFTLHPSASQRFNLIFTPTQPGPVSGQLTIGNDTFTVTAKAIGPRLIYSYTSAGSSVPVAENGVVIFPPLAVGSNAESLTFSIQNTGTSAATISSINLTASSTVFSLSQLPSQPMNLDPGATTTFTVSFLPNNVGSITSTLVVNSSNFTLSGSGTQPAALPAYHFTGASGNQPPAQQPSIGLSLASAYPLALQGTLKLTFVSSVFADDSTIQFASGGRTVTFTIPANTTQALFNGSATSLALQSGTTAGSIVITPSFALQSGFDLTPSSASTLTLAIQPAIPQLLSGTISAETTTSFTVILSGYSTSRVLRSLDIQITPRAGQTFSTTHLTVDVGSPSASWFQSTVSQGFGGSFLVAVPFTLSNGTTGSDLVHQLQSLSITATNDVGTSSAVTVPIP